MTDDETNAPGTPALDNSESFGHFVVPKRADGSLWELGRGSMGVTYRAYDTSLRIEVALKVIAEERVQDSDMRRRFQREARAAARVRHPNVASVLYLGEQGGEFFYAMEFIAGRSVDTVLKGAAAPLPMTVAIGLAAQAAAGLNAAHRREVVHRDLKPANLMLLEQDALDHEDELTDAAGHCQLKIIDFGLARSFGAGRQDESMLTDSLTGFVGTPTYASPEQCSGEVNLDGRSDLYSLGVILWQMLTGDLPFSGRVVEVLGKHQFQPAPFEKLEAANVPPALVEILRGLLAKQPADRYPQTAGELRSVLDNVLRALVSGAVLPTTIAALPSPSSSEENRNSTTPPVVGATLLSRYRLGEESADGDGGRLFLAADNHTPGLRVGLKLLSPNRLADSGFAGPLETALERVRKFPHPVVLDHPFGLQRAGGTTFYVREWAEGFSLFELMETRKSLRAAEVRTLLAMLPSALDHAVDVGYPLLEVALHKIFVVPTSEPTDYGDWLGLRSLPVETWPPFKLKMNPLGFKPAQFDAVETPESANAQKKFREAPTIDATRLSPRRSDAKRKPYLGGVGDAKVDVVGAKSIEEPSLQDKVQGLNADIVAAFARLIRELLGGLPASQAPLSAIDGKANAVLRRAQMVNGLPAAYPSSADFSATFFDAIGKTHDGESGKRLAESFGPNGDTANGRNQRFSLKWLVAGLGVLAVVLLGVIAVLLLHSPTTSPEKTVIPTPVVNQRITPAPVDATPISAATTPTVPSSRLIVIPVSTPPPTPPPAPALTPPPVLTLLHYKGEVHPLAAKPNKSGMAVTVDLYSDRSSGIITFYINKGYISVRFTVTDKKGAELRATTGEVLNRPEKVGWQDESFVLSISPDNSEAKYNSETPPFLNGTLKAQPTPGR